MSTKLKLVVLVAFSLLALPSLAFASVGEINSASPGAERILLTSDGGLAVLLQRYVMGMVEWKNRK